MVKGAKYHQKRIEKMNCLTNKTPPVKIDRGEPNALNLFRLSSTLPYYSIYTVYSMIQMYIIDIYVMPFRTPHAN